MRDIHVRISGMGCQACVGRVSKALQGVPGVEVRQVNVGEALVRFDPDRTDEQAVSRAIADAGYEPGEVRQQNA